MDPCGVACCCSVIGHFYSFNIPDDAASIPGVAAYLVLERYRKHRERQRPDR